MCIPDWENKLEGRGKVGDEGKNVFLIESLVQRTGHGASELGLLTYLQATVSPEHWLLFLLFLRPSHFVVQAGLELMILLA